MMKRCKLAMEDRISSLPSNIIELILMCLPIAEAVRTSILSSRWRYQWCTIPNLIFDKHTVPSPANYRLESIVDQILLLHIGPIHKFVFDVNSYPGIKDRWLIFLSRKNLKELALKCYRSESYKIPTALYSCHAIESLDLYACGFKLPYSFNGFSCLTSLLLKRVRISGVDFSSLVSKCPILKKLAFIDCDCNGHLLQELMIGGMFDDIHLENMPELVSFSLRLEREDSYNDGERCRDRNFNKCLGNIPKIEILELLRNALYFVTRGGAFKRFPTYSCLKKVILSSFDFEAQELVMTLCSLLQNTPVLRELQLETYSVEPTTPKPTSRFLDWMEIGNFNLDELRMVRLTELVGVRNEMDFIEFILSAASRLESLIIQLDVVGHEKVELFKEIMRFRRSSPRAEIIILD